VVVTGRIRGSVSRSIEISGRVGGQPREFEVQVHTDGGNERPALAQIWARMKIMDLADRSLWSGDRAELTDRIRSLALEYSLMSKFTAFVAVDSSRRTEGEAGYTVAQPVPVPHGVKYETTVDEGSPN
jgi:Ca-activated chloride channel family protein